MGEAGAVVGDKRRASCVSTGTGARQSSIDRHLSVARTALTNIRAHNAAAHLNHMETRQLVGKIDKLLNAGASRSVAESRSAQQTATDIVEPVSKVSNRGAVAPAKELRNEQPAATNIIEQSGELPQNGTVTAPEAVRNQYQNAIRDARSVPEEELIFSNSDLLGEEYEAAGTGQSAEQIGSARERTEQQPSDSDNPQRTEEAEL